MTLNTWLFQQNFVFYSGNDHYAVLADLPRLVRHSPSSCICFNQTAALHTHTFSGRRQKKQCARNQLSSNLRKNDVAIQYEAKSKSSIRLMDQTEEFESKPLSLSYFADIRVKNIETRRRFHNYTRTCMSLPTDLLITFDLFQRTSGKSLNQTNP